MHQLLLLSGLFSGVFCSALSSGGVLQDEAGPPPGSWHKLRDAGKGERATGPDNAEELADLGYAGGYEEADEVGGATIYDAAKMEPGATLFSSGHAPVVQLIDAAGEMLHQWSLSVDKLWPDGVPWPTYDKHEQFVRRAILGPGGELLVVFETIGVAKVDRDGETLWAQAGRYHHDLEVLPDGRIVTLSMSTLRLEELAKRFPGLKMERPMVDNQVCVLGPDGTLQKSLSVTQAFYNSDFAPFLGDLNPAQFDAWHTNSVDWIDAGQAAAHPLFPQGTVLLSIFRPSALVLLDLEADTVRWMAKGPWRNQHQAQALPGGQILLLDNRGGNRATPLAYNRSRALEYDPNQQNLVWEYPPKGEEAPQGPLYTALLGYVQRCPRGNTLITESTQGRMLEVTREGQIVWEYRSPFRAGENRDLIATIMGGKRIAPARLGFLSR